MMLGFQASSILAGTFRRGLGPGPMPLYAQALVGSVSMTAQWWLDTREPKKEVVAAHLVNLMWNGPHPPGGRPHQDDSRRTNSPQRWAVAFH